MSTIRLNATDELLTVLAYLKGTKYALMDNPEIIRAVLSEHYMQCKKEVEDFETRRKKWKDSLPELKMTPEEREKFWDEIDEAQKSEGKIMTIDELFEEIKSK